MYYLLIIYILITVINGVGLLSYFTCDILSPFFKSFKFINAKNVFVILFC